MIAKKLDSKDVVLLVLALARGRTLNRCQLCAAVWLTVRTIPAKYLTGKALEWRTVPWDGCDEE